MAEARGNDLEDRLTEKLRDIFFNYPERVIRDALYTVLVDANSETVNEEILLQRCVDALILPTTPAPAAKRPRPTSVDGSADQKRSRPSESESGSMANDGSQNESMNATTASVDSAANESSAIGADLVDHEAKMREELQWQQCLQMLEMFPWIEQKWLAEQVKKADFNKEVFIEYVLNNSGAIPKKEKVKPQVSTSAAAAASKPSGSSTETSADIISTKDYLNDYTGNCFDQGEVVVQFLAGHFHWIAIGSIRSVLGRYNFHLAPTFNAFVQFSKKTDFQKNRGNFVSLTISKTGSQDYTLRVKLMKSPRRHTPIWDRKCTYTGTSIPPDLQAEISWLGKRFNTAEPNSEAESSTTQGELAAAASSAVSTTTSSSVTTAAQENAVFSQQLQSTAGSYDMFECGICCDEYIISEQMVACTDGHLFCNGCLRSYAREAIYGQMKTDLGCMNDGCDGRFLHDMLTKALDADLVGKLEEKRMNEAVNIAGIEGLERCKYCNYAIIFEVSPEVNKVFKCDNPQCEREYCRICYVDWEEHIGKPCKEVETEDDTKSRREAEERMAAAVIRHCNKCKAPLIKEEGCNKLTCSCGAKMCYICRETICDYKHFCQHVREPGQVCTRCKSCSLWENPTVKDAERVKKIQKEVNQKLSEAGKELKVGVDDKVASVSGTAPGRYPGPMGMPMLRPIVDMAPRQIPGPFIPAAGAPVLYGQYAARAPNPFPQRPDAARAALPEQRHPFPRAPNPFPQRPAAARAPNPFPPVPGAAGQANDGDGALRMVARYALELADGHLHQAQQQRAVPPAVPGVRQIGQQQAPNGQRMAPGAYNIPPAFNPRAAYGMHIPGVAQHDQRPAAQPAQQGNQR